MPKNGGVADRHAQTLHQPLSRSATPAMPKKVNKFSGSIRPTTVRTNNLRQAIRKCPTLAFPVQTSPAAYLHPHHHGGALRREVLKMTDITGCAAVSMAGRNPDRSLFPALRQRSPSDRRPAPLQQSARRAPEPNPYSFACSRLSARPPTAQNSTKSEADPITRTFSNYLFAVKALKSSNPDSHV